MRQSVEIVEHRMADGTIVKSYKGISKAAKELGITRKSVYKLLNLCID